MLLVALVNLLTGCVKRLASLTAVLPFWLPFFLRPLLTLWPFKQLLALWKMVLVLRALRPRALSRQTGLAVVVVVGMLNLQRQMNPRQRQRQGPRVSPPAPSWPLPAWSSPQPAAAAAGTSQPPPPRPEQQPPQPPQAAAPTAATATAHAARALLLRPPLPACLRGPLVPKAGLALPVPPPPAPAAPPLLEARPQGGEGAGPAQQRVRALAHAPIGGVAGGPAVACSCRRHGGGRGGENGCEGGSEGANACRV